MVTTKPTRTGPSHAFPVVRGPSVGLGCTGGTAPGGDGGNFTGHGKILTGPTARVRDRRPQTVRVSADRNDPNQPAPTVPETVGAGLCIPVEQTVSDLAVDHPPVVDKSHTCRGHGSHRRLTTSPACSRAHDAVPALRRPGPRGRAGPIPHGRVTSRERHHPAHAAAEQRPLPPDPTVKTQIPGDTTWNQNNRPGNPAPAPSAAEPWPAGRTGTAPTSRACTAEYSSTRWLPRMACPRRNRTALHHRRCETAAG